MTTEEKKEIKRAVLDEIKAESNDITEIETVSTLDGLTGLPAMQGKKLVTAPLSLLSKPATDAAVTANSAADTANKAANKANTAASMISPYADCINLAMNGASARFDGFVEGVIIEYLSVMSIDGVYYDIKNKRFCAKKDGHYYNNWVIGDNTHAASMYLDDGRRIPRKDKMYVCGTNLYVWSDEEGNLVVVDKTTKELGTWLITHDNVTTIDALNHKLDAFDAKTAQGLHHVKCWGIPLFVTLSVLNVDKKVLMQTITGSITLNADNTALGSINGTENYTIAVRYYQNSKWGKWSMPLNPPTAQTGASGTKTSYIYSAGSDQDTKTLVTSKFWIYKHSDFNLFLRFKHWGANNDEAEENYSQVQLPNAWTQSNGLLRRDIYARLDAFELREQNSTATEVKIVTPIFTTGGTRTFPISSATSAKAGVMSADMFVALKNSALRIDQATFVMPESYLPTVDSSSVVVERKADYIRMAKAVLYGGYVCIRQAATQSDKIYGDYLVPVTEAQAKYTDDDNFKVKFVYNGNRYSVRCLSGTMSHSLEENYAPTIEAQMAALAARIEALEKKS